jgi:hypothetical protein
VLVPGTGKNGVLQVASSNGALAYIRAAGVDDQGRPVSGPDLPIDVVDATTGTLLNHIVPRGTPVSLALTPTYVATLERTAAGPRISWYTRNPTDSNGGGSVPVSSKATSQITAGDRWIVYRVGRSIRGVDTATGKVHVLAHAAADPVGLSLDGSRLAWAENLGGWARIRALYLTR